MTTTQITKPKLVIAPVISQLAQTSTSTTTGSQSQPPKHMANLLLPVSIPQQNVPPKSSMFSLKINNGQINTDSKGTITGKYLKAYLINKFKEIINLILYHSATRVKNYKFSYSSTTFTSYYKNEFIKCK